MRQRSGASAALGAILLFAGPAAYAQEPAAQSGEDDHALNFIRASKLMHAKVYNADNEHLGSIDDLAVAANEGLIVYAVLARGGVLGVHDEKYAVSWPALNVRTADRVLVNIDKQTLKDTKGFRGNNWPAYADRWLMTGARGESAQEGVDESASDLKFSHKGSDLVGKRVKNEAGDDLGKVKDLVITPRGRILYGVIGSGGRLVPVPWTVFDTTQKDWLRLDIEKSRLETAPNFPDKNWPALSDRDFIQRVYQFYNVEWRGNAMEDHNTGRPPDKDRENTRERHDADAERG